VISAERALSIVVEDFKARGDELARLRNVRDRLAKEVEDRGREVGTLRDVLEGTRNDKRKLEEETVELRKRAEDAENRVPSSWKRIQFEKCSGCKQDVDEASCSADAYGNGPFCKACIGEKFLQEKEDRIRYLKILQEVGNIASVAGQPLEKLPQIVRGLIDRTLIARTLVGRMAPYSEGLPSEQWRARVQAASAQFAELCARHDVSPGALSKIGHELIEGQKVIFEVLDEQWLRANVHPRGGGE
jgi:hypothetical protein